MSGFEVAGLVLGGFPLLISALEHYATMEELGRTWWRFRREYKKDLDRLGDVQLLYRGNMRTLLAPLEWDGTLDATQIELLLEDPASKEWCDPEVNAVVSRRLGEFRKRYLEILMEMKETVMKLATVSKVNDNRFQSSLNMDKQNPSADSARGALIRINDRFQYELGKVSYTFGHFKREGLIDEIDRYTKTLDRFLSLQDGMSNQTVTPVALTRSRTRVKYAQALVFWKHADRVFHLMQTAWQCACAPMHCAYLPLHQNTKTTQIRMDLIVKYSGSINAQQPCPWSSLPLSVNHSELPANHIAGAMPAKRRSVVKILSPGDALQSGSSNSGGTEDILAAMFGSAPRIMSTGTLSPSKPTRNNSTCAVQAVADGSLCGLMQKGCATKLGACVCALVDRTSENAYGLFRANTPVEVGLTYSLKEILQGHCTPELYHGPRLSIAHAIAGSFLQLYTTPWLNESAMSTSICVPVSLDGKRLLHEQAFVHSHFEHVPNPDDKTFALLGILFLELCYNKTLEQHPLLKQRPELRSDTLVRNAVAIEWAKEVEYVWSYEGAQAINWCLHSASSQHEGWRGDFASNVVEPLRVLSAQVGPNKFIGLDNSA